MFKKFTTKSVQHFVNLFTKMESLNADCLSNILEHFNLQEWLTLTKVSSKWNNFVDQLCFSEITTFQNVNLHFPLDQPEFYPQLPVLSYREGLELINRVAPYLQSLMIEPHFAGESAYLQFGPHFFEMRNFHLSHLFEIIGEKCVNLETVSIDTHTLSSKLMAKIVENNPKLRLMLSLVRGAISHVIPSFDQIYLHGSYKAVEGFSGLGEQFSVIDMSYCSIVPEDLPAFLQEVLKHKKFLQCLRIKIIVSNSEEPDCSALADLGMCSALTVLSIDVEEEEQIPGDFFEDIIKGCTKLESVYLKNVGIDDETCDKLMNLPCLEEVIINVD